MKKYFISFLFTACSLGIYSQTSNTNFTAIKIERYKQDAKVQPTFIPLEIGEISPKGWILDWATSAANGITGHLDEYVDVYKHGWKGFGFKAMGVNEDGTGWPLEQCSYWLDGAVKLGYILQDTMLIRKTSNRLNLVVNGVLNGGETFIYWKPYSFINDGFNNWGHGLMGRALVSYYQATHDPKVLQALVKVYKKFTLLPISDGFMRLNRGATNIDAMTETYLMSGEKDILDSITAYSNKCLVTSTVGFWNDLNKKFVPDKDYDGVHGVSFYEILRVPAMMYPWTGKKVELRATKNILKWGEKSNLLPIGVCSSEENLAGIGSIRNVETCNVPTSMWSLLWILRLTGDSKWSDKVEKIFFNAGSAPIARDFKAMCYYQSPNRFSAELPEKVPVGSLVFTDHGCDVLCCVGNVNNVIPDYIGNMWMATMDNGLAATLYGPCSVKKKINDIDIKIDCNTSYPFDDKIEMNIHLSESINMPLYFRIPEWCANPSITINGKVVSLKSENGFVKINRTWNNNDAIVLVFPKTLNVQQAKENSYPQIKYYLTGVSWGNGKQKAAENTNVRNPYEYVTYGPLLFSLPIADIDENHESPDAKFNYALNINHRQVIKDIEVIKKPLSNKWTWQITDAPIQLRVKAKEIKWKPTQMKPLPDSSIKGGDTTTITLIPYGCTKFRISMFPITEKTYVLSK